MANLIFAIDDDILQKVREAALRENTSVNALVRDFLGSYVDVCSRRLAALSDFERIAATQSASAESWSRESPHERV